MCHENVLNVLTEMEKSECVLWWCNLFLKKVIQRLIFTKTRLISFITSGLGLIWASGVKENKGRKHFYEKLLQLFCFLQQNQQDWAPCSSAPHPPPMALMSNHKTSLKFQRLSANFKNFASWRVLFVLKRFETLLKAWSWLEIIQNEDNY